MFHTKNEHSNDRFASILLLVALLISSTSGLENVEDSDDLDALIEEIFSPGINEVYEPKPAERDCTCVPYYLCENDTVITDGVGLIDIRVKGDCDNYLEVCCRVPLPEAEPITPPSHGREGCGRHNPEGVGLRITGNENGEAQFGEFPWMVAVLREQESNSQNVHVYQCGGALIHPGVVLTAAHCVNVRMKDYRIRAGDWDTQTRKEPYPHRDAKVKTIVVHPGYNPKSLYNDVALLFLESAVTLADNIDVVCLPRFMESFDHSRCFASGWGKDTFGKEGKYQSLLKKVELPIVPKRSCENALRNTRLGVYFRLHSSFVCAGGEAGRDTCIGDGGSPLVCPMKDDPHKFVQVGIVAWGIKCGEDGTPGVYADVASLRIWIDTQLKYRNLDTRYYEY